MEPLAQTPEICLLIAELVDIPVLLSLRLVNRGNRHLIDSLEDPLASDIQRRHAFSQVLLREDCSSHIPRLPRLARCQRRQSLARRLSGAAPGNVWPVDLFLGNRDFIGAVNRRSEQGWYVLWHLSDVARDAERRTLPDPSPKRHRFLSFLSRPRKPSQDLERDVLRRRLEFIEQHLTWEDAHNIGWLHELWSLAFAETQRFQSLCDLAPAIHNVSNGTSWIYWFILHEGPAWFEGFWERGQGREARLKELEATFQSRSKSQVNAERAAANRVYHALRLKMQPDVHGSPNTCLRDMMSKPQTATGASSPQEA